VKGNFQALHARTLCHATENLEKVKKAFSTATGNAEMRLSRTEGHHGNLIVLIEATLEEEGPIKEFFERFGTVDLETMVQSLPTRIDEGCNLFIRIDKQSALQGVVRLGHNDDVISIRLHVRSFPAKCELASIKVREYIVELLEARKTAPENP